MTSLADVFEQLVRKCTASLSCQVDFTDLQLSLMPNDKEQSVWEVLSASNVVRGTFRKRCAGWLDEIGFFSGLEGTLTD